MNDNELKCDYTFWAGGISRCPNEATYTLRLGGKIYHYCKEHYLEVKEDLEDISR